MDLFGLGQMGSGIAANLLKAGHELSVYNRSAGKAEALVAQGATLAKTQAAAAQGDVVFTMLATISRSKLSCSARTAFWAR